MNTARTSSEVRKTKETDIQLDLNIDGSGVYEVDTGIGFFDHMLEGFSRHGFFDLKLQVKGDLHVDSHHTIEDTGIVLGTAIKNALGKKEGIRRYGSCILPMDETLVLCALDLSGRPYFSFDGTFDTPRVGEFDTELVREFMLGFVRALGCSVHLRQFAGENSHHIIEALFKAFAKALDEAVTTDPRIHDILSTKGSL